MTGTTTPGILCRRTGLLVGAKLVVDALVGVGVGEQYASTGMQGRQLIHWAQSTMLELDEEVTLPTVLVEVCTPCALSTHRDVTFVHTRHARSQIDRHFCDDGDVQSRVVCEDACDCILSVACVLDAWVALLLPPREQAGTCVRVSGEGWALAPAQACRTHSTQPSPPR